MDGLVYINHGRVIVDCPFGCKNAYLYRQGETKKLCNGPGGCSYTFQTVAPDNLAELLEELKRRPNKQNQNWFPEGHPIAVRGNFPMGQSVADLAQEFEVERGVD